MFVLSFFKHFTAVKLKPLGKSETDKVLMYCLSPQFLLLDLNKHYAIKIKEGCSINVGWLMHFLFFMFHISVAARVSQLVASGFIYK